MEGAAAVVVTYFPDAEVLGNLAVLRGQMAAIVVVDNGSPGAVVEGLRGAGYEVLSNGSNLGIARALNQGVAWARARGGGLGVSVRPGQPGDGGVLRGDGGGV